MSGIDDRSIIAILVAAVKDLASKISTTAHLILAALTADEVTANDRLCVGDTCVTPDQFRAVFGNQPAAAGAAIVRTGAPAASAPEAPDANTATTTMPAEATSTPPVSSPANYDQASPEDLGHEDDQAQSQKSNPEPQPQETAITDQHPANPAVVPPDAEPTPDLTTSTAD